MTKPQTDLLGDPVIPPLPENLQLFDIAHLAGHTIKTAIDSPNGRIWCDLLIITETGCWLAIGADGDDEATASVAQLDYRADERPTLLEFASALSFLNACYITRAEYEHLRVREDERIAAENRKKAESLRAHAARLEAGRV